MREVLRHDEMITRHCSVSVPNMVPFSKIAFAILNTGRLSGKSDFPSTSAIKALPIMVLFLADIRTAGIFPHTAVPFFSIVFSSESVACGCCSGVPLVSSIISALKIIVSSSMAAPVIVQLFTAVISAKSI